MITLEYTLTEREYKEFNYYTGWLAPERKSFRIRYYIINMIIYTALLGLFFLTNGPRYVDLTFILLFIAFGFLFFFYLRYRVRSHYNRQVNRMIRESGQDKVLPKLTLTFSESGINGSTSTNEVKYFWKSITHSTTTATAFYLFLNSRQAIIVPKRVFQNAEQSATFETLLKKSVKS
jgi:hypothetical protein